ncbi:hypothetical protein [Bacillus sp. FJAT-22090]|uniref:hypothetical protein n=1 Tax=Bacillus sp. FJAT-22090 TaxID=1581038 RepID=UPI0011A13949|nr:hypothetical protein [Bacillus sp. FJAT-22090]
MINLTKRVNVLNLLTGEEMIYTCDPLTAVKSAYCMENGLMTKFATTLGKIDLPILRGKHTISCGDWTCRVR